MILNIRSVRPRRYLSPCHAEGALAVTDATPTVARVLLMMMEVPIDCWVDAIIVTIGSVQSGNHRVGIYGPVAFATDTCQGAALLVESASVGVGSINSPQTIPITETFLARGKYYIAYQADNNTMRYLRQSNGSQVQGWVQFYDRSGGYGAFTNPCPTITETGSNIPGTKVRVSKF